MITPTDDWFYLIIFLWSKNLKRICQNNYLDVGSEKKLLFLNYGISYKRKNLILDSTFLISYYQSNSNCTFIIQCERCWINILLIIAKWHCPRMQKSRKMLCKYLRSEFYLKCLSKIFKWDKWLRCLMETDGQQLEGRLSSKHHCE